MANHDVSLLRVIDAAANRASEGLRVAEDYVRFVLDDVHLTERCKQLRHDLAACLAELPQDDFIASRETQADIGTALTAPHEASRPNQAAVVAANLKRAEQALRSLEEYGKVLGPAFGSAFEQMRYRVYTLERMVVLTASSRERLADVQLYVLIDGRASMNVFVSLVEGLVNAGASVLQLRDKQLSDRQLIERAHALARITRGSNTLSIVNDRPDIARIASADGVHVGQDDLSVKDTRVISGSRALVGVSTHSLAQARTAVQDGASYIGVGPTFASSTKHFDVLAGVELLRAVSADITLPAFAIGGITLENLDAVLAAGVRRVAVGRAITEAADPPAVVREFLSRLHDC